VRVTDRLVIGKARLMSRKPLPKLVFRARHQCQLNRESNKVGVMVADGVRLRWTEKEGIQRQTNGNKESARDFFPFKESAWTWDRGKGGGGATKTEKNCERGEGHETNRETEKVRQWLVVQFTNFGKVTFQELRYRPRTIEKKQKRSYRGRAGENEVSGKEKGPPSRRVN